jgi:hypothetical protein
MGRVANAIEQMNSHLASKLSEVSGQIRSLNGVAAQQLSAQQHTVQLSELTAERTGLTAERTALVLGATTAGFTASTLATTKVKEGVDRGTAAAAELATTRRHCLTSLGLNLSLSALSN